jgi:hypothetical protein
MYIHAGFVGHGDLMRSTRMLDPGLFPEPQMQKSRDRLRDTGFSIDGVEGTIGIRPK